MQILDFLHTCANGPDALVCISWAEILFPAFLFLALVARGVSVARRDRPLFRKIRRFVTKVAIAAVVLGLASAFAMHIMVPDLIAGPNADAMWTTLHVAALGLAGSGAALLIGAGGFAAGGMIAKSAYAGHGYASPRGLLVAIDGPAASGKGTLARRIASHFNLPCLDTGLLYRAVARDVQKRGWKLDDERAGVNAAKILNPETLDDPALRGPAAGDAASVVAKIPNVRAALLDYQRCFAYQKGGAVLDGRDIGTVVCPNATVKIFITASAEERARRRHSEHEIRGERVEYDTVLADIRARDARDSTRDIAPLEAAPDAVIIDTTTLDADAVFKAAVKVIEAKRQA